jgi:hypothetical protein
MIIIIIIMNNSSIDIPEENENEVGGEENEEQSYIVENPSLDLEVGDEFSSTLNISQCEIFRPLAMPTPV